MEILGAFVGLVGLAVCLVFFGLGLLAAIGFIVDHWVSGLSFFAMFVRSPNKSFRIGNKDIYDWKWEAKEANLRLAEADGLISTHQYAIDKNPPDQWPDGSFLAAAIKRHCERQA